jgi:peptide/nickel transport system permease protein
MLKALFKAPSGVAALVVAVLVLVTALVAPWIFTHSADTLNISQASQKASSHHLLGTDSVGRDILARVLVGTRLSILVALAAAALGAGLGMTMGVGAVVLRGRARTVLLRFIDACIAFPALLVAIFIGVITGPGILGVILGVGIAISFSYARVTSTLALAIVDRDFISAARLSGTGNLRLMFRYVLPNIAETLAITTTVAVANSVTAASTLSFLGLGVQPPRYDWGRMLTEGVGAFYINPAAALGPAAAIAIAALAFGFTGEAIARVANPTLWAQRGTSDVGAGQGAPTTVVHSDSPLKRPAEGEAALEVSGLTVSFPGGQGRFKVVDGVSFWLRKGERLGIVGESGSGKTTTALAIAQLVSYPGEVQGSVLLQGTEVLTGTEDRKSQRLLGTELAVVYQDPMSSLNPALRIGRQMTEASETIKGDSRSDANTSALARLQEVNIPGAEAAMSRYPHELSGGMRQRVMIAMGLMMDPPVIICDEPTTALDATVQAQIMDLIAKLNADHGSAVILISHNLALVSQNTDRVLVMYAGRIVEDLTAAQLHEGGAHPYTQQLLAAVPDTSRPREERLAFIPGQAPDPANLPNGCPYSPRCPLVHDTCRTDLPPLLVREDDRRVACWAVTDLTLEPTRVKETAR